MFFTGSMPSLVTHQHRAKYLASHRRGALHPRGTVYPAPATAASTAHFVGQCPDTEAAICTEICFPLSGTDCDCDWRIRDSQDQDQGDQRQDFGSTTSRATL
ncbi:hypothetical protein E4U31_007765 [Claviceps sp. LM219 group G6]|nr:hypothetical protein E4U15_003370 [Claviceps sp. LM218 group G6]KAG6092975.1 hypothetical protein E4U14_000478 [Claviceps sp. LM454 group G7]KAG6108346.1 hypothetical protein E4U31_007765 [Claviceps sp. LM219 group G6]